MIDPALFKSNFERLEGERYFTAPRWTRALIPFLPDYLQFTTIWEPAAGRGDIVRVLQEEGGYTCTASDIDISEFNYVLCSGRQADFFTYVDAPSSCRAIITNPPYGTGKPPLSERFVRHALSLPNVEFVAMLLRSEFNSAGGRSDLFNPPFAFEVVLTARPRWDWWMTDREEKSSPRHNFSWFVWDRTWKTDPTQYFTNGK